ncbi:MAG: hypothetical protein ACK5WZ_02140 [Pseudobdellovibrionaceae bacterium]
MKVIYKLVVILLTVSCAKANYQNATSDINEINSQNELCAKQFGQSSLCVDLVWEQLPTEDLRGIFKLKFYRLEDPSVMVEPNLAPSVVLWMPSMGHGSAPVQIQKVSDGIYQISEVYFVMSGEWDIRVQQKLGKEVIDQVTFPFVVE